jgi:hypothetical protein
MNDHEQLPSPMRKSRFRLFDIEGAFEAFTKDDHWNGWECPFFTRAEGMRLVEAWNALGKDEAYGRDPARYVVEKDCFEFMLEGEIDSYSAEATGGIELYPIGEYGWCWEEEDMNNDLQVGDSVTYADPQDEVERSFIGTVIGHWPDGDPPRTTVRWQNSNFKIAPVLTHEPKAWVRLEKWNKMCARRF